MFYAYSFLIYEDDVKEKEQYNSRLYRHVSDGGRIWAYH